MIQISYHAAERLQHRVGVSDKKIQSLALKAWKSKEPLTSLSALRKQYRTKEFPELHDTKRIVRQLMGYTFIFAWGKDKDNKLILVTVI